MASEDIANDYTEVDSGNHINTATADTRADFVTMPMNLDIYFYKDFGASNFGNYIHFVDTEITDIVGTSVSLAGYSVATTLNDIAGQTDAFQVQWVPSTGANNLRMQDASDSDTDSFAATEDVLYYLKCIRTGTTWSVEIYTGGREDTLVDTIALTGTATAFRYVLIAQSNNQAGGSRSISGYWKDLDLQEAVAGANVPIGMLHRKIMKNLLTR